MKQKVNKALHVVCLGNVWDLRIKIHTLFKITLPTWNTFFDMSGSFMWVFVILFHTRQVVLIKANLTMKKVQ